MLLRHANKKKIFTLMTVGALLYAYNDKLKSILFINMEIWECTWLVQELTSHYISGDTYDRGSNLYSIQ